MADNLSQLQHAQSRYQCLAEATFEGIVLYHGEDIVEVNQQFADMFGYTIDELVGTNCIRLVAPKYKTLVQDLINKEQLGQDIPERLEAVGVHKDGHRVVVELRSRKIDPDIPYHIAVVRDVTASQARFERLAEASFEGILIHEKGVIIESNQQFADMIGYSLEELKGFNGLDLFTPESQEMAREKIASGDPGPYEAMCVKKDGSVFPVEIRARMIHQEGRDIRVGVVRDLTEQNRLTERLRDSEQLYRTLVEGVTAGVAVIDTQGRYLLVNDTACEHNALSRDQLMGSTLHDLYSQETADTYLARIRRIITSGQDESACEQTLIHGCQRWFQIGFFPLKNGDGQYDRVIALAFDIHEQKQLEQELARKNKQYKKLYENAPTALFRSRISDGKIIMCNTALSKMNGFETPEDCIQSNFLSKDTYVDPKRRRQLIDRLKQEGTVTNFEAELNVPDGGKKWISISAEIFEEQGYLEGSLMDITAMRALTRAEKTILHHLMQGKSNKEIARHLERAVRTVEDHRANIMGKLEVNNIVDLTQIALNLPTLQDDPSDG